MPGRNLGFRVEIFGFGHRFRVETIGPSFGFPDRNSQVPDLGFRIETRVETIGGFPDRIPKFPDLGFRVETVGISSC